MIKYRIVICLMFAIFSVVAQNDSTIIARSNESNSRIGDEIYFNIDSRKIESVSIVNYSKNRYNTTQYKTYRFSENETCRSIYSKSCNSCDSVLVSTFCYNGSESRDTILVNDGGTISTLTDKNITLRYGFNREEKYTIVESDSSLLLLDPDNETVSYASYFSKDTIVILDKNSNTTTLIYDQNGLKTISLNQDKSLLSVSDTLSTQCIQFIDEGFSVTIESNRENTNISDVISYLYLTNRNYELFPILISLVYKRHIDIPLEIMYIIIH